MWNKIYIYLCSISIAGPFSKALNDVVNGAIKLGYHVIVAAGNYHTDACFQSPASAELALTIGSSAAADYVSSFSNFGPCVDMFAPGEGILSAFIGTPYSTAWSSGTSMAAPHVSGVKALYLAHKYLNPQELDAIIVGNGTKELLKGMPLKTANILIYSPPDGIPVFELSQEVEEVGESCDIGGENANQLVFKA